MQQKCIFIKKKADSGKNNKKIGRQTEDTPNKNKNPRLTILNCTSKVLYPTFEVQFIHFKYGDYYF